MQIVGSATRLAGKAGYEGTSFPSSSKQRHSHDLIIFSCRAGTEVDSWMFN